MTTSIGSRRTIMASLARPRRRTSLRPRPPAPPRRRHGTAAATVADRAFAGGDARPASSGHHHRHFAGIAGQLDGIGQFDDRHLGTPTFRPAGDPRGHAQATRHDERSHPQSRLAEQLGASRRRRLVARLGGAGRGDVERGEHPEARLGVHLVTADVDVQCSSKGTARATTPAGTSPDADRSDSVPASTAGASLRSRRTSSADPEAAVASASGPVNAATPGNAAEFSKTSKLGDVNSRRRSSCAPKASVRPAGGGSGSPAVDCAAVDVRHDDVADGVRREEPAAALRRATGDVVERLAELVVGGAARGHPAVDDARHAGRGEGVRDAVAEVMRSGRQHARVADVEHPEVAEVVGGDARGEQAHHRRARGEPGAVGEGDEGGEHRTARRRSTAHRGAGASRSGPPATSEANDATAHAAASARPRATGTSSMPISGTRNGRASRSCSTARPPKATTSPAARPAHVRRHARDSANPVTTGTYKASASRPSLALPMFIEATSLEAPPRGTRERHRGEVVPRPRRRRRNVEHPPERRTPPTPATSSHADVRRRRRRATTTRRAPPSPRRRGRGRAAPGRRRRRRRCRRRRRAAGVRAASRAITPSARSAIAACGIGGADAGRQCGRGG